MTTLLNRDVFSRDPAQNSLQNDGVSKVNVTTTLEYELETFVCDGEYARGLERILSGFESHLEQPTQPSAWVSGFYGSGKSHLVKILQALWQNDPLPSGLLPRDVARLSPDIRELLITLSRNGDRAGGLWSASGMLTESDGQSVRMLILSIVHRAAGLSSNYGRAKFRLWLRTHGWEDPMLTMLREQGRDPEIELNQYLVSFAVADAVTALAQAEHRDPQHMLDRWEAQFNRSDVSLDEMIADIGEVLRLQSTDGMSIPLTLLVLDEVQQYIGDSGERAQAVQEAVERLQSSFDSKVLVVATGQAALNSTPNLQKLEGRFTTRVMLQDKDVERVVREVVLQKRSDRKADVTAIVDRVEGEIDRQLAGTQIAPRSEDKENLVRDYPLLPVRSRFWAKLLHAIDPTGTTAQLRTQLRVVHSAAMYSADKPLGHVIPADFIYDQLQGSLLQSGVLPRDVSNLILEQDDGTEDGKLRSRLIQLIYLIERIPTGDLNDTGVRATPTILADLVCEDLLAGSDDLRRRIPDLLKDMEDSGKLIRVQHGSTYAYAIQTGESLKWNQAFQQERAGLLGNPGPIGDIRSRTIEEIVRAQTSKLAKTQGKAKAVRSFDVRFGTETPQVSSGSVVIWVRDGWSGSENRVVDDARTFGEESPLIQVFVPQRNPEAIRDEIATFEAAKRVVGIKAAAQDHEAGRQAASAMSARMHDSESRFRQLLEDVVSEARVYQGGGNQVDGTTLFDRLQHAANASLQRLFPQFSVADHADWDKVFTRATQGSADALKAVEHTKDPDQHEVIREIRKAIPGASGISWTDLRKRFMNAPYGWPQDAVDGAVAVLVLSGAVNAVRGNTEIRVKDLSKQQANATTLIGEDEILGTREKLLARRPFVALYGRQVTDEEVRNDARTLVRDLENLAHRAGGEAPIPLSVVPGYLLDMENQTGNGLVKALAAQVEQIETDIAAWRAREQQIAARMPAWKNALTLAEHARSLPESGPLTAQLDAVRDQRLLLDTPDPVPAVARELASLLRDALNARFARYDEVFENGMASLKGSDEWVRLSETQQDGVLRGNKLVAQTLTGVGSEEALLSVLRQNSLSQWDERINALPTRIEHANADVARLLEPTIQDVSLEKPIFRKPIDVENWILKTREDLLYHINNGHPVRIT